MKLGNLSIDAIEKRAGVAFPKKLKDYMSTRKQENASDVAAGRWHCFDIPFVLVCGDMETATEIHKHLEFLGSAFKEPLQISITSTSHAIKPSEKKHE